MKPNPDNYHDLLDNMYDGVYFVDRQRRITYWNKAAEKISGFSSDEVVGKKCSDNVLSHVNERGKSLCKGSCPLARTLARGVTSTAEVYLHHKNGHRLPVAIRTFPVRDTNGKIVGAVELFNDISSNMAATQRVRELEHLIYIDRLTEIANRSYLEIFIKAKFDEMHRYGWSFGLIFSDIDRFKNVNDTYGHDVGDMVLRMVAQTLEKRSRSFDLVGRWGGEEFISVTANVNKEHLVKIAERTRRLVAQSGITLGSKEIRVTISIGATMAHKDDTLETLVQRADRLMYQSKAAGRNRVTCD